MVVEKKGDKWCVLHGHAKKPGSKTDKAKGEVIGCHDTKKEADAQHTAILISQHKKKKGGK